MQTLTEIREILAAGGLSPLKRFGQCFLYDQNLMSRLLELADVSPGATVLEVGPGTGSLTEELLARAGRVVAAEIDHGLAEMLRQRYGGEEHFTLIEGDVLSSKHRISEDVHDALGDRAEMVSNLPYNIATPLVAQCLIDTWNCSRADGLDRGLTKLNRLTFTVQKEVASRLSAGPGDADYGPVSVLVALLSEIRLDATLPPQAFWPQPKVLSRMVRIEFLPDRAGEVQDIETLMKVVNLTFIHRRKQVSRTAKTRNFPWSQDVFCRALEATGIDSKARPDAISPEEFRRLAGTLSEMTA